MAIVQQLPPGTQFYQPVVRFSATFNAPTLNRYDFNTAANTGVPFQAMRKSFLYLIERYSFSGTIPEGVFFEAVDVVPTLEVRIPRETNRMIHPNPIPLINYVDGLETLIYAYGNQEQDLTGTFRGVLFQPGAIAGVPEIDVQVQFNIYEVKNVAWIENFLGTTRDGQAPGLLTPARGAPWRKG
jgi:hypothetical protein